MVLFFVFKNFVLFLMVLFCSFVFLCLMVGGFVLFLMVLFCFVFGGFVFN